MRAVAKANMWLKRRYHKIRSAKPVTLWRWLVSTLKKMGIARVGLLGVEQAAIIQCLIVKLGKVWIAVRIAQE